MTEWKYRVRHDAKRETFNYKQGCFASLDVANDVFDGIKDELNGESFTIILEEVDRDYMGFVRPVRTIKKEIINK